MAKDYKPIPVETAKHIAKAFNKSQVVILAFDPKFQLTHTTTYGVNAIDKENAAAAGEKVSKAIGCDLSRKVEFEDFHKNYDPAKSREQLEELHWWQSLGQRFLDFLERDEPDDADDGHQDDCLAVFGEQISERFGYMDGKSNEQIEREAQQRRDRN